MVLCVDIGGTSTKAGLLDPSGQLHFVTDIPTRPPVETYFAALAKQIGSVQNNAATAGFSCIGMGVAVAGFLTPEKSGLFYNSNLAWLEGYPLRDRLSELFNLPVQLEVDSNCACMAEYHFGCGKNAKRFLCAAAGTGLGVGLTVSGQPLRFAYGCLGDIGHIIVEPDGPLCTCGGRGCAEVLISAPLLAQKFSQLTGGEGQPTLRRVIEAAHTNNEIAIQILQDAGKALGIALASMANFLFPDHIAVAGGLSAAGPVVMETAEQVFRQSAGTFAQTGVTFSRAALGPSATLIGAAWPFWNQETWR